MKHFRLSLADGLLLVGSALAQVGKNAPDTTVFDGFAPLRLCLYRLGKGRIILHTLRIRENLGEHPVAERLLRNMLICAADEIDEPPADLPAGLEQEFETWGY